MNFIDEVGSLAACVGRLLILCYFLVNLYLSVVSKEVAMDDSVQFFSVVITCHY